MRNDPRVSARVVRSKYFWVPFWLAIATATGFAGFYLGQNAADEAAGEREYVSLMKAAMSNPVEGIGRAQDMLEDENINFDVYRKVIQAALHKPEIEAVEAAFESMNHIIGWSGDANKRDVKKMIDEMKPIVLLALPSDTENLAGLDKEFRAFDIDTVFATHKDESRDNAVNCYSLETCKESAERVKALLAKRGYEISGVTQIERPNAAYNKRIDVLLAPIGKGKQNEKAKNH